jgi:hypothetical protein
MRKLAALAASSAAAMLSTGTAHAAACAIKPPVSVKWGFVAKHLTASGIAPNDPHGAPCYIARFLTYYAERRNGLPTTLNLDPDGQPWTATNRPITGNAVYDVFRHGTERVSVTLTKPMTPKDAKAWARQTLEEFESAAHPDPFLNVPDDAAHSDGGQVTCKVRANTKMDCTTVVNYGEDAYWHTTAPSGQVYVNYKADRVVWTERLQWLPALFVWHLDPFFPEAPKASTFGGDEGFAGKALHRTPWTDTMPCGNTTTTPCSMVPYTPGA